VKKLQEITNLWIRLIVILYFMENPKTLIKDSLRKLTKLTKKLPAEIKEVLNDLSCRGILKLKDDHPPKIVREKIWTILDKKGLNARELEPNKC
jgi:hypothetical protein